MVKQIYNKLQIKYFNLFIFIIFLILPYIFFAIGINISTTPIAPGDGFIQGLPTKIFSGNFQLWNPLVQGGSFTIKDLQNQSLYLPGILIMKLFPNSLGYNFLLLFHYTLAGFFTYLYLRKISLNKLASVIGGISFMFCGFLTAHKGHHAMLMTAAYLPIVLFFFESYISSKRFLFLFLTAFSFANSIFSDHTQISLYIGMVTLPYIAFRTFLYSENDKRSFFYRFWQFILNSTIIFLGGVLIASIQIIPILESLKYVTREKITYSFFESYSFPIKQLPILIFPYIFGTHTPGFYSTSYYGKWNLTEMTGYMGILPLFFSLFSILFYRKKNNQIYFWLGVVIIGFILVLGGETPIYKFLYHIPLYNMFRAPARNWLEVNFAVSVLSSIFIHLFSSGHQIPKKDFMKAVFSLIVGFLFLIIFILTIAKNFINNQNIKALWVDNVKLSSSAIFIPIIIIIFSFILLLFLYKNFLNKTYWGILTLLLFLDLYSFGHFHDKNYSDYSLFNNSNEIASFLSGQDVNKDEYRILTLDMSNVNKSLYPQTNLLYKFNAVNSYGPNWLKNFKDLTQFDGNGLIINKPWLLMNSQILSILSVKYLITSDQVDKELFNSLVVNKQPNQNVMLVKGLNDEKWFFPEEYLQPDGSVILQSKENSLTSLIQIPFEIKPNKFYKITFKASKINSTVFREPMYVDFYSSEGFDSPNMEYYVDDGMISNDLQEFQTFFYSENLASNSMYLRFFTISSSPYLIKDITLTEMNSIPFWSLSTKNWSESDPLYKKIFETSNGIAVYENLNFLPRTRFVKNVIKVYSTNDAIKALKNTYDNNPATTAYVEDFNQIQDLSSGKVINSDYSRYSQVDLQVRTEGPAFLVLSDSWYPGWKAYINGKETKIYKTNAVSRGIFIPNKGNFQVQFKFIPISFYLGLCISIITIIIYIILYIIDEKNLKEKVKQ